MAGKMKRELAVGLVAGLLALPVAAQERPLEGRIGALVAPYVTARDFMGVVGVQKDGEEPLTLAYGLASAELGTAHRADGIFLIGSVSKQFTAVAILLLEEDGALSTTDTVAKHLPDFARGGEITIQQLLTHTSGVKDVYSLERFGSTEGRAGTFAEVLADLSTAALDFSPGSRYAYSNGGYSVLAAIIESASGQTYGDFLRQRVLGPLGLRDTVQDRPSEIVPRRVSGYDPWGRDSLTAAPPVAPAYLTGSGSLWSSAGDLLKWSRALHGGGVLSEAAYRKLTQDYGRGYGYGLSLFRRFDRAVFGHDGRVSGFASDLAYYVEDGLTIAILSNVQSVARDEIRRSVAAAVLGEEIETTGRRVYGAQPAQPLQALTGTYAFGPSFKVSIRESEGRLLARANQGGSSELVPLADGAWFSRMLYATVRFGQDAEGRVDRLIWGTGEGAPVGTLVER